MGGKHANRDDEKLEKAASEEEPKKGETTSEAEEGRKN